MADYININGNNIPIRASDPSNPIVGEIWYNTTTNALKGQALSTVGTFASAPSLPVVRAGTMFSVGSTQDAVLSVGSNPLGPPPDYTNRTDVYDGTSWTAGNPIIQPARNSVSSGGASTAAAKMCGGYSGPTPTENVVEDYDGTCFSTAPVMPKGTEAAAGFGTQTAMVVCSGGSIAPFVPPGAPQQTDEWDGATWTTSNPLGRHAQGGASSGSLTAGLFSGGSTNYPGTINVDLSSSYDGTSWTTNNTMNTAKSYQAPSLSGTQTASVIFGGSTPSATNQTEIYDGTCWSNTTTLPSARYAAGGAGTASASLISGGYAPSAISTVDEWIGPGSPVTQTISSS